MGQTIIFLRGRGWAIKKIQLSKKGYKKIVLFMSRCFLLSRLVCLPFFFKTTLHKLLPTEKNLHAQPKGEKNTSCSENCPMPPHSKIFHYFEEVIVVWQILGIYYNTAQNIMI